MAAATVINLINFNYQSRTLTLEPIWLLSRALPEVLILLLFLILRQERHLTPIAHYVVLFVFFCDHMGSVHFGDRKSKHDPEHYLTH